MRFKKKEILKIEHDGILKKRKISYLQQLVATVILSSAMISGTYISQGFDSGIEREKAVVTTIEPSYNYFNVSLDNEKKDGILIEAKAEILARQKIAEEKAKAEAEARAKAEAEAKAKAEAKARAQIKINASTTVSPKNQSAIQSSTHSSHSNEGYYNPNIPLPKDVQAYLYQKVKERGLDFAQALAIIKIESGFNPNAFSGSSYGYFQINKVNHQHLANKLGTPNAPYDPYVNINWGTYMLADLYATFKAKGYTGTQLTEAVLSSYNKGIGGYQRTGIATSYCQKYYSALKVVQSWL